VKKKISVLFGLFIMASMVLGLLQLAPAGLFASVPPKLCPPPNSDCFKIGDICKGDGVCKCGLYLFCLIAE
jgi:hypothetical protein